MAPKRSVRPSSAAPSFVSYDFEERTYQIDPERRKVYRRFVEIETSKAFEILSTWRAQNA